MKTGEKVANLLALLALLILGIQLQAISWGEFPVLDPLTLVMPVLITFNVFLFGEALEYWARDLRDVVLGIPDEEWNIE